MLWNASRVSEALIQLKYMVPTLTKMDKSLVALVKAVSVRDGMKDPSGGLYHAWAYGNRAVRRSALSHINYSYSQRALLLNKRYLHKSRSEGEVWLVCYICRTHSHSLNGGHTDRTTSKTLRYRCTVVYID